MRVTSQAGRMRLASQAGQMVCYHCQQPRHMRRDCPQSFGTSQSQSVAEKERIQYVPPQHDAGHRGQSQFQGATRAPHLFTGRPERPEYGQRQRARPTGRDIRDLGAFLRRHTAG